MVRSRAVAILCLLCSAAAAEEALEYQARLLTPVASYSRKGSSFQARIVGALSREQGRGLPSGTIVSGEVVEAHPIRLGLRRERAVLHLRFGACHLPTGAKIDCTPSLVMVDNARETLQPDGRITGILAASHPHSWLGGVWVRPGAAFTSRSATGLTGTTGKLQNTVAPTAIGAGFVIVSRLVLFRLPNAEIELPSGTELVLRIDSPLSAESSVQHDAAPSDEDPSLAELPFKVEASGGRPVGDIINLAFLGSRELLEQAFAAAGWWTADPLTTKSVARVYAAVAGMKAYPRAPVSNLYYENRLPDLVFQKLFNSVAKRHHIRFWQSETTPNLWLGAATHDVALGVEWSRFTVNHVIDPRIDRERQVVLNDLLDVGCLDANRFVERPAAATQGRIVTDGALAVARLAPCRSELQRGDMKARKERVATRITRRLMLESRHYVVRSNPYYWAYRGVRRTVAAAFRNRKPTVDSTSESSCEVVSTGE